MALDISAGSFLAPSVEWPAHRVRALLLVLVAMASTALVVVVVGPVSIALTQVQVAVVAPAGQSFSGVLDMRVAALKNGVVVAVLEARDLADAQDSMPGCVVRLAISGDILVVIGARQITPKEFRDKFTPAELGAIIASTDVGVRVLLYKISTTGDSVDLDSVDVQNGLLYLQAKQLLTDTRRTAILS